MPSVFLDYNSPVMFGSWTFSILKTSEQINMSKLLYKLINNLVKEIR